MPVRAGAAVPPARARSGSSSIRTPSACSTSDSFGVHVGQAAVVEQPVARIEQHGHRRRRRARRAARRIGVGERGRDRGPIRSRTSTTASQPSQRRLDLREQRAAHRVVERPAGVAIDAHDLLPRGVNAAGEDARLHRRPVLPRADHVRLVDAAMRSSRAAAGLRRRCRRRPRERARAAERRDVVRRVAGAARHHLRWRRICRIEHRALRATPASTSP